MIPQAWRAGARRPLKYKIMKRANDFLNFLQVSDLNALFLTPLQGENQNSFDEQRTRPKTVKNTATPPFPLTPQQTKQQKTKQKVTKTMKNLPSFTHLAFLINWTIDERPATDLSFAEIHAAAGRGRLVDLLAGHFGHIADFSLLLGNPANLEQIEAALCDAASALEGREAGKVCVSNSGLCLAMAIVLEAIQQQFHPSATVEADPETV